MQRTARFVGQCYVRVARGIPRVFGMLYRFAGFISSSRRKSPIYYVNGLMAKKLNAYLAENHYDAIVMPHLFPAETITYMKRHGMKRRNVIIILSPMKNSQKNISAKKYPRASCFPTEFR